MKASLHAISSLEPASIESMFTLFQRHFEGVSRPSFLADLLEKNWVLLLKNASHQLAGFSTLDFRTITDEGNPASLVYSGDTIVDPSAWNSTLLPRAWIEAVFHLHHAQSLSLGPHPLWWLLITSGFRTYRLLPVFWLQFHPCWNLPTPPAIARRLHHFASLRFGSSYDPSTGLVRFPHPQRLRPHLHGIPENRIPDPHIAFFASRNPGHLLGDELVSLTELHEANLTPAGRRVVASIRRHPTLSLTP